VFDNDGLANGEYFWGSTACFDLGTSGDFDSLAHAAGTSSTYSCGQPYPDDMNAWMVYGPVDLSASSEAQLLFDLWLDIETDYDRFIYAASTDNTTFYGYERRVGTDGWLARILDLTQVPTVGDLTGESQVWIAFVFKSDYSNPVDYLGAWLDGVVLRVR
jgi:hypothetical protein